MAMATAMTATEQQECSAIQVNGSNALENTAFDMAAASSERFFCEELEEDLTTAIENANKEDGATATTIESTAATASSTQSASSPHGEDNAQRMIAYVAKNLVGRRSLFDTPYGDRALCYADFTASGKSLACIETYMQREVLPLYGNTHTTTSITGLQTTCFRHEARQIVAQAVNAKITGRGAEDAVLFTGQGTTSAVSKLVTALGLHVPLPAATPVAQRPVVFVGPFEHHSNLLPWRESAAEVVVIPEDARGLVDMEVLTHKLQVEYAGRALKIGAFSAASNLTGVLTDVDEVTAVLHRHGALAFWDYASCAPYVEINMNPVEAGERRPFVYKDAIYFSGHKFIGGPGSPGVLVVKKRLLSNAVPTTPGGGTVFFVTERDHRYLSNREEREEGGTPDILGSIRLGLAFELKQRVGAAAIMAREVDHVARVRATLRAHDGVVLLGREDVAQLPVFAFLVRCGDRFLHYNFVCALLNDLFGIQTRGGCQCAGPYATRLLGLSMQDTLAFERALIDKKEMLRPGFSRFSVPYFMDDQEVSYLLDAILFIADHGWSFLPQYRFNHKSGAWKHSSRFTRFPNRKWLSRFTMDLDGDGDTDTGGPHGHATELKTELEVQQHRRENLAVARRLADENRKNGAGSTTATATQMLDEAYEALRWFVYPSEASDALAKGDHPPPSTDGSILGPYQPQRYLTRELQHQWEQDKPAVSSIESLSRSTDTDVAGSLSDCCPMAQTSVATPSSAPSSKKASKPKQTPISASQRELGGKYPLRSTEREMTVDSFSSRSVSEAPSSSSSSPSTVSCGLPLSRTQQVTSQMTEKTVATKLFPTPPKKLMRSVGQALMQWGMIQEGDRLLLGLSGGKDSLSLLHVLLTVQKRAPVKFYLACATVDPQTPSFDPSPLKDYLRSLDIEYHYLSENIIERASCEMQGDSLCSYCARMKRGVLYTCCRQNGFNKLVLAQHLDDLAESFLMSAMQNGQLRTMKAKYWNEDHDVEILRPLVYTREHELKRFAYDARLPVINENCPACFEEPKERHRVKKMLAQEESLFPEMYNSFRRALLPLMDNDIYAPMIEIRNRIEHARQARPKAASSKNTGHKTSKNDASVATESSRSAGEQAESVEGQNDTVGA